MNVVLRALLKPMPISDSIYVFDGGHSDPWGSEQHKVQVIETTKGWVRYKFLNSSMWQDERLPRGSFHFCYRKRIVELENGKGTV